MDRDGQRALALDHANAARLEAAQLCAQIRQAGPRGGARRAAEVVAAGTSGVKFGRLLRAVPRIGSETTRYMLGRSRINGDLRVCDVHARRRQLLAGLLLGHAERRWKGGQDVVKEVLE